MNRTLPTETIPMTICFFVDEARQTVLLAKKTRKIGVGKFNGYGGKNHINESPLKCAQRECEDECGLTFTEEDAAHVAQISFQNKKGQKVKESLCDIFVITHWQGSPIATEEMQEPTWFPINNLPFDKMMAGDSSWVGRALDTHAATFKATLFINENGDVDNVTIEDTVQL